MPLVDILANSLNVTLPVFVMVFVGLGLRRLGWIDTAFVSTASALVFKATLPALIFMSLVQAELAVAINPALLAFFALATLAEFVLAWWFSRGRVAEVDRGIYIQGAFRGNCGIVGLALAAAMYGSYGLSAGGVLLSLVILLYNTLSVVALIRFQPGKTLKISRIISRVAKNPLILAVVAAIPVAWLDLSMPVWVLASGEYFASLTMPLALICIGATLSGQSLAKQGGVALEVSLLKVVVLPLLGTLGAIWAGFNGRELGLLFVFLASPTAAASFVMVKASGGNARLAASIVAMTTLMAIITLTLGLFGLELSGLL